MSDGQNLSNFNLFKDATIHMSTRLRGGMARACSSGGLSYKDVTRGASNSAPSVPLTKPPRAETPSYIVEKLEEIPAVEVIHLEVNSLASIFQSNAIICRFNGFWPKTKDLHNWIHSNWSTNCDYYLCTKGFFIVQFFSEEDYQQIFEQGPWFWGRAELFVTPWFADFDPNTMVVTKMPVWVRLRNLPLLLCHNSILTDIGNCLGKFIKADQERFGQNLFTYARICVEVDLSKGLPDKILLTTALKNIYRFWTTRIRHLDAGHAIKQDIYKTLALKQKVDKRRKKNVPNPKHWQTFDPPLQEDEEEEEIQEEADLKEETEMKDPLEEKPPEIPSTSMTSVTPSKIPSTSKTSVTPEKLTSEQESLITDYEMERTPLKTSLDCTATPQKNISGKIWTEAKKGERKEVKASYRSLGF